MSFIMSFLFFICSVSVCHAYPSDYKALFEFKGSAVEQVSGATGIIYGAQLTTDRFGNQNSAYAFDGVDDYIQFAHQDSYNYTPNSNFTVGIWVKADPVQMDLEYNVNDILSKWNGHSSGTGEGFPYTIRLWNQMTNVQGKVMVSRFDPVTRENPGGSSSTRIDDGIFHHIVFSKDGAVMRLYVDGNLEKEMADTTTYATNNTANLYFGRRGQEAPWDSFFRGVIDDAYIWDRPLSQEEVIDVFTAEPTPIPSSIWLLGCSLVAFLGLSTRYKRACVSS